MTVMRRGRSARGFRGHHLCPGLAAHAIGSGLNAVLDNASRVANDHATGRNAFCDDTAGTNDRMIADGYARQDDAPGANEAIPTNMRVALPIIDEVVRQNRDTKGHG